MKNLKYLLMLGVASSFLLNSQLAAKGEEETETLALAEDSAANEDNKPAAITPVKVKEKKEKKKLSAEEVEAKKAAGQKTREDRYNSRNEVAAEDGENMGLAAMGGDEIEIPAPVMSEENKEIVAEAADAAQKAADEAKIAATEAQNAANKLAEIAAMHDEHAVREKEAQEKAAKDAEEAKQNALLKHKTNEAIDAEAREHVIKDHQHRYATALVQDAAGSVKITETAEQPNNKSQQAELAQMGIGTDMTAELAAPVEGAVTHSEGEAPKEIDGSSAEPTATDPITEEVPAARKLVEEGEAQKSKSKKEKKKLSADEIAAKKEAGKGKNEERAKRKAEETKEDLDTSINEEKAEEKSVAPTKAKKEKKAQEKKEKKKLSADEIAAKKEAGKLKREQRVNKKEAKDNAVEEDDQLTADLNAE